MANEELGRIECDCGQTASVYQAKRKGAHLYSRCPSCGLDQRTGAKVQARLYWGTDWNGGIKPTKPDGVGDEPPTEKPTENKPERQERQGADYVPPTEPPTEKQTDIEPKSGLKAAIGALLLLGSIGGLLWKM